MVKLTTAREVRLSGTGMARKRAEYINTGLYLFATVVLLSGFLAEMSRETRSGLVLLMIALGIITGVNLHNLITNLAGIDYRLSLVWLGVQLAIVEIAVPIINALGSLITFLGVLFLFIQAEKGYVDYKLGRHAMNLLVAGPELWLQGLVHNSCQLRSSTSHGIELLGRMWVWLCAFGSLMFIIGGLVNVVKVFRIQRLDEMLLEKLRGGGHEQLVRDRDGSSHTLLVPEDPEWRSRRRRRELEEAREASSSPLPTSSSSPYKDVLVDHS